MQDTKLEETKFDSQKIVPAGDILPPEINLSPKQNESMFEGLIQQRQTNPQIKEIISRNSWSVSNLLLALIVICLILYLFNFLQLPKELSAGKAHADWFLVIVSIIAVVGAIWAILARVDAEKAFKEAERARIQSEETYKALQNSFSFLDIYHSDKIPYIYDSIGKNNVTVTLFLAFPIAGLFETRDPRFAERAFEKFKELILKLHQLDIKGFPDSFRLNIACYEKSFALQFLSDPKWKEIRDAMEEFYILLDKLQNKSDNNNFTRFYFTKDLGLRITLATPEEQKGRALVWIVSNFIKENPSEFEATCFQTEDKNFVATLDEMYRNFKPKSVKPETIEFKI